ncbi:MAG: DUF1080 domain-containing protein [Ginsengibacter sp.]
MNQMPFSSTYYFKPVTVFFIPFIFMMVDIEGCSPSSSSNTTASDSTSLIPDSTKNNTAWEFLFNGKNTSGWHTYGKSGPGSAWKAEDSSLHLDASIKKDWQTKDGGDLVTDDEYENFDLSLQWKISEAGNSGIMFYVHEDTSKYQYSWNTGPEMQVADNEKNEDGKIEKSRAGDLYDLVASTSQKFVKPAGQWNLVEIISDKGKLDFFMNDQHVLSTMLWTDEWKKLIAGTKFNTMTGFGMFKKGKIALQDHGADVWFRDIKIRKL